MIHSIENDRLRVSVKTAGCELAGIFCKDNNTEYLWQGNPDVWYGQSPILFPIVGRLIDDRYTLDGVEYEMPKHGFARKTEWTFLSAKENEMKFILKDSEATRKIFPYEFDFTVTYQISGNKLKVTHEILNRNDRTMYFSLGAHPGFNCTIGDKLVFSENETLETEKIDLEKSLRIPETFPVLNNSKEITITEHIFDEDALILHGIKSEFISLYKDGKEAVKFNMGRSPYLGIWAKPGAPYVCIEPWCGVNDSQEKKADFSLKDGINSLPARETFTFCWEAEIIA